MSPLGDVLFLYLSKTFEVLQWPFTQESLKWSFRALCYVTQQVKNLELEIRSGWWKALMSFFRVYFVFISFLVFYLVGNK